MVISAAFDKLLCGLWKKLVYHVLKMSFESEWYVKYYIEMSLK